jgi:ribose-phosphate pyrophosphokinase
MPGIETVNVSAAPLLAAAIDRAEDPILVSPDAEGKQWVEQVAGEAHLDYVLGEKLRLGDRRVVLTIPHPERLHGRHAVIVDDIISSGATMRAAARQLFAHGAVSVDVLATHCLASARELAALRDAGIRSIRACDTIPGPAAVLSTIGLLAGAIRGRAWKPALCARERTPDNPR